MCIKSRHNVVLQVDENVEHAGKLKIILIDPDEHPLMLDIWEDMFGIDIEHGPQIGLVDISEASHHGAHVYVTCEVLARVQEDGLWFDMEQLNLREPEKNRDDNEEILQAWIDQILDGSIDLDADDGKYLLVDPHARARCCCHKVPGCLHPSLNH